MLLSFFVQQVSYNDRPEKAYEVFVSALASRYLNHDLVIPTLLEAHNPAGTVSPRCLQILNYVVSILTQNYRYHYGYAW